MIREERWMNHLKKEQNNIRQTYLAQADNNLFPIPNANTNISISRQRFFVVNVQTKSNVVQRFIVHEPKMSRDPNVTEVRFIPFENIQELYKDEF